MATTPASKSKPIAKVAGTRLRTPRAAAIAGILFALLFITSMSLMRLAVPESVTEDTLAWVQRATRSIHFALSLVPFVGIAFLWFLGVLRDRLGQYEDKFFSTVFFGSGLLFLAMVFVSAALGAGILAMAEHHVPLAQSDAVAYGREVMYTVMNIYGIRMAGVFMLSLSTIWLRTGILPRSIGLITLVLALAMLVVMNLSLWFVMVFPLWVLGISIYILVLSLRSHTDEGLLNVTAMADEAQTAT